MLKEGTCETTEPTCDVHALFIVTQRDTVATVPVPGVPASGVGTDSTTSSQRQHYETELDTMLRTFEMLVTAAQESQKKSQDLHV